MTLAYVQITGEFADGQDNPLSGTASFVPNTTVYASGVPVLTPDAPIRAQIVAGQLLGPSGGTLQLLATDNAGLSFAGQTGFLMYTVTVTIAGEALEPWSFVLPHSTLGAGPVDLYSLANTTAGGAGFSNPMVLLGDLISGASGGAAARLAGPVSGITPYVLTSTPSGGVAQAPAWQPFYLPWQFLPETYGAKGDGVVLGDCSITNLTNSLSSTSYQFVTGDAGKHVMLNGGLGPATGPLIGVINSVLNGHAVLSVSAAATISGNGAAVFGTDDRAALEACEAAAGTYAIAHDYYAEVLLRHIYIAASGPVQSTSPAFNSQIPAPYPALNGTSRRLVIRQIGAALNGHCEFWESTVPNVLPGSIVSMATPSAGPDPTYGYQSVIGGPSGGGAFTGSFANVKLDFSGVAIWVPAYSNLMGADLGYIAGCRWEQSSVKAFAPAGAGVHPWLSDLPSSGTFQATTSIGVRFPLAGNNDDVTVLRGAVEGFQTSAWIADHFTALGLATVYGYNGLLIDLAHSTSGTGHKVTVAQWSCEALTGAALTTNGGPSAYCPVNITMDGESPGITFDIQDTGNCLYGVVNWDDTTRTAPILEGGANLTILSDGGGSGRTSPAIVPGGALAPKVVALTQSGGTVAVNAAAGNVFTLTLTSSAWTIANPANAADGQIFRVRLTQDGTGGRTVAWGSAYDWGLGGSAPGLSSGPGKCDIVAFEWIAALSKAVYLGAAIPQGF